MKINNVSLPYPVLGNSDDILPLLPDDSVKVERSFDNNTYTFNVTLRQDNPLISLLIEQGYAAYTCEVTCPRTMLRRCYKSETPDIEIKLGRREVFGRIDFNCFVTVYKPIPGYRNELQNEDYGDAMFDMEPGDILVAFPTAYFPVDITYDMLYSAGSLMVVLDGGEAKNTWHDANDDKIKVYLPHAMFEQYGKLYKNRMFNSLFHASIVFQVLFKILSEYKESTYGQYLWAEAIKTRIDSDESLAEFDINDTARAYELTHGLLGDPYQRMFNKLQEFQENHQEEN